MRVLNWRNGLAVGAFLIGMTLLALLARTGTTWAAPGAQGTVPTPPVTAVKPTAQPPPITPSGGNRGSGDQDSGGSSPSSGATSGAPATGAVCVIAENGALCLGSELILSIASGAAAPGSAVKIEGSFSQPPCPASPAGQVFLNRCFRYTWTDANAQPLTTLGAPVQYCLAYGAEQLALANNRPETFLIGFAGEDGAWTLVKPTLDAEGKRTCATSNQLVVWSALFASSAVLPLLPTTGADSAGWWLAGIVLGLFALLVAARLRRRANEKRLLCCQVNWAAALCKSLTARRQ